MLEYKLIQIPSISLLFRVGAAAAYLGAAAAYLSDNENKAQLSSIWVKFTNLNWAWQKKKENKIKWVSDYNGHLCVWLLWPLTCVIIIPRITAQVLSVPKTKVENLNHSET